VNEDYDEGGVVSKENNFWQEVNRRRHSWKHTWARANIFPEAIEKLITDNLRRRHVHI
jgi:hypothetical protein